MATYQFPQIKVPKDGGGTKKQQPAKSSGSSGSSGDFNSKHKRAAAGTSTGGQFVAMSYDSKRNVGTGYGSKQGDSRVKKLQTALNRLGLKDKNGKPLVVDGKLGPLTTSSVIAAQKKLGITPADGKVTPALLAKLTGAKSLSGGKAKPHRRSNLAKPKKPLRGKQPAAKRPPSPKLMPWQKAGKPPPSNFREGK